MGVWSGCDGHGQPGLVSVALEGNPGEIRAEQKYLQTFLKVDFSNVLKEYNDYLFNDADLITQNIEDITQVEDTEALEEVEALDEIEEIDEIEELGDVDELEEL